MTDNIIVPCIEPHFTVLKFSHIHQFHSYMCVPIAFLLWPNSLTLMFFVCGCWDKKIKFILSLFCRCLKLVDSLSFSIILVLFYLFYSSYFFRSDSNMYLREVSWHFATHDFVFIPHLKSKYSQLIVPKLSRKSAICPRRSPWRLIVLVRSLRSARLDTAWLVKSVAYFNLIG